MKRRYLLLADLLKQKPHLLKIFQTQDLTIYCQHKKNHKVKKLLFSALEKNDTFFYATQESSWLYFCDKLELIKILRDIENFPKQKKHDLIDEHQVENEVTSIMGQKYLTLYDMAFDDRLEVMKNDMVKLQKILDGTRYNKTERMKSLVTATTNSALSNKISLEEITKLSGTEAEIKAKEMKNHTEAIMDSIQKIITKEPVSNSVFHDLIEKSDGTTVKHMLRVFFKAVSFVEYVNDQVHRLSLNQKIRMKFDREYKHFYYRLFPNHDLDRLNYNIVFGGSLEAIEGKYYQSVGIGYMLHDIGKEANLDYYESGKKYDREIIESHVRFGYNLINKTNTYPDITAMVVGYHHEYYNADSGYGPFRDTLKLLIRKNPNHQFKCAISNDVSIVKKYESYSFLPAKILEIIDVYDALTDQSRKYKNPLSPADAIDLMKTSFIEEDLKLDPILFDIFITFLEKNQEI